MKKNIDITNLMNELKDQSAFFRRVPSASENPPETSEPVGQPEAEENQSISVAEMPPEQVVHHSPAPIPSPVVPEAPRLTSPTDASMHASTLASLLASYHASSIDHIRKTVKTVGKEVTFVRLTVEEKNQLSEIAYAYKRQGIKTSENEISRIAINFLLEDYKANGEASILAKVLASLLA